MHVSSVVIFHYGVTVLGVLSLGVICIAFRRAVGADPQKMVGSALIKFLRVFAAVDVNPIHIKLFFKIF